MAKRTTIKVIQRGAVMSSDERYRLTLRRGWNLDAHYAMFIGLNPSTADANEDDPTIRRCVRFAHDWGYGGIYMLNVYAYRATDPKVMLKAEDPNGMGNDMGLRFYSRRAGIIIAAWGVNCPIEREKEVCKIIDRPIHCLGLTKDGRPRHPLYVKADTQPQLFWPDAQSTER